MRISDAGEYPSLKTLVKAKRFVTYTNPGKKDISEARYLISSLTLPAHFLLEATISH
jgi:hypothetical protein